MGPIPWRIFSLLLLCISDPSSGQLLFLGPPPLQLGPPPGSFPPGPPGGVPAPVGRVMGLRGPPNIVFQPLVFEYGVAAPDNYVKQVITINGQFPGPPIRVKMYDILNIEVVNKLDHGIVLHFHGIRNYGEPEADGVALVTQELIPPGTIFRYKVGIGFQTGTFMYHLHNGLDSIGSVGPLIIEDDLELLANHPEYHHIWDHTFILQQWYHTANSKLLQGLTSSPYTELPEPDSILINGRSFGNWNESNTMLSPGYEVLTVKAGATYRFRIIGFGVNSILSFKIAGHSMKIIAVDGIITKPIKVDHLQVNSGQRYSVLVTMNQAADNYMIESEMIPGPGPKNGRAILNYEGVAIPETLTKKVEPGKSKKVKLDNWEALNLSPNAKVNQPDIYLPPTTVDKEIVIKSHQKNDSAGLVKFHVNGEVYKDPTVPLLFQLRGGVNITKEPQVYESITNKSIQLVFQNLARYDGVCEQHPWHVHGHSFYIVGQGPGAYDKDKDRPVINKKIEDEPHTLVFRDVVTLYPNFTSNSNSSSKPVSNSHALGNSTETHANSSSAHPSAKTNGTGHSDISNATEVGKSTGNATSASHSDSHDSEVELLKEGTPCGWVAVRFVTDNPGVWLAHCHLTSHLLTGEEFVLREYQEQNPTLSTG